jgi:hypothetical protein
MNINDYFTYFENKNNVKLSMKQKQAFVEIMAEEGKQARVNLGQRSGKTVLFLLVKDYYNWRERSMEKYISCKNVECSLNKAYKETDVKKEDCVCTRYTEKDLQNRMFCEERDF